MSDDLAVRPFSVLSLCSGIGGLDLGVAIATGHAARTVCYVEREGYCASVLQARMASGHLDDAPIWSDLKTFDARPWRGKVDCITAGYPCQPFSVAGRRKGKEDPRHLWPFIKEHVATIEPSFVFCENVVGHLALGFEEVCEDLSAMGYRIEAGIFSAEECGAPHRRERLFFVAHRQKGLAYPNRIDGGKGWPEPALFVRGHGASGGGCALADTNSDEREPRSGDRVGASAQLASQPASRSGGQGFHVADIDALRQSRQEGPFSDQRRWACNGGQQELLRPVESAVDEPTDGLSEVVAHIERGWHASWEDGVPRVTADKRHRVDALRALGNAVVPAVAVKAWRILSQQGLRASP